MLNVYPAIGSDQGVIKAVLKQYPLKMKKLLFIFFG